MGVKHMVPRCRHVTFHEVFPLHGTGVGVAWHDACGLRTASLRLLSATSSSTAQNHFQPLQIPKEAAEWQSISQSGN